jgi:von Hippel-Lindau disease tumor suppressor protein
MSRFHVAFYFTLLLIGTDSALAAPIGPEDLFKGCENLTTSRSPASKRPATMNFVNKTKGNVNVIWIDFNGVCRRYATLTPNSSGNQRTYIGHVWLITNSSGDCLGAFQTRQSQNLIVREPRHDNMRRAKALCTPLVSSIDTIEISSSIEK